MDSKNLLQMPVGSTVRIENFEGGESVNVKLRQHGLFIGDHARVLRKAPFAGPILLDVNGREIALSRGIAARIFVGEIQ